jgi:uncharacterized protein YlzI (FlbEa/FlbD family)
MTQARQGAAFIAAALFQYVTLHTLDGREVYLNTKQIVGIGAPKDETLFSGKAKCVVHMADGKFVSVTEDCTALKKRIEDLKK